MHVARSLSFRFLNFSLFSSTVYRIVSSLSFIPTLLPIFFVLRWFESPSTSAQNIYVQNSGSSEHSLHARYVRASGHVLFSKSKIQKFKGSFVTDVHHIQTKSPLNSLVLGSFGAPPIKYACMPSLRTPEEDHIVKKPHIKFKFRNVNSRPYTLQKQSTALLLLSVC